MSYFKVNRTVKKIVHKLLKRETYKMELNKNELTLEIHQ